MTPVPASPVHATGSAPDSITAIEFKGTGFDDLTPDAASQLLAGSRIIEARGGRTIFPVAQRTPRVGMVLRGTARSFLTASDGRQLTVRYARRGALVGKFWDLSGDHAPLGTQAVTDCTVLEFDVDAFSRCAATQVSMASAIADALARRLEDIYATVGDSAFGSIRQRIIRHLLALAQPASRDTEATVQVSQQQVADAIGSSREVVSRQLAELRSEGLIRTGPRVIELLAVDRLAALLNHWQAESPY
jgi:CRP/FNR family transcriptional regulator, cyclic AMP receptor protein